MNDELDKYYELLGVPPGTSGRELKDAYRDLAKVWHPDRFSHDPRLRQKAQEKLKEINEAYARLASGKAGRRTRPAPAPGTTHPPAATAVRRKRPGLSLLVVLVFAAAFLAALSSLVPRGARHAPGQAPPDAREAARPSDNEKQTEGEAHNAAGQAGRGKGAARRATSEAASGGTPGPESGAPPRPMQTVTVTIDAVSGQLATRDCPIVSTVTFPAGGEPRQRCTAAHEPKEAAKGSRLKSVGKRLAAPVGWLGGEKGAEAGEARDARTAGGDGAKNR